MNSKPMIWVGMFVGSTIGGLIPTLWGSGMFSFSSITLTAVGGLVGIYIGLKLSNI